MEARRVLEALKSKLPMPRGASESRMLSTSSSTPRERALKSSAGALAHPAGKYRLDEVALGPDQLGGAMELIGRDPDVHAVEFEGLHQLLLHQVGEGLAAHSLQDLSHQISVRESVVPGPLTRRVHRLGLLDGVDHVVPVEHPLRTVDHLADVVEPRLVRQHVADGDPFFARLCELRPVGRNPLVVVDEPPVHHDVHQRRGHTLRGGEARRHGVGFPGVALRVARAAPQVDHAFAAVVDAQRGSAGRGGQLLSELAGHASEGRVEISVQIRAFRTRTSSGSCELHRGPL
jgi:hypothetical protein